MNAFILKNLLRLVSVLMILLMVSLGIVYYLLTSERGARIVLAYASSYLQDNFSITLDYRETGGTVFDGLSFEDLSLNLPGVDLHTNHFESEWSFWSLLRKELDLERLVADQLSLSLSGEADSSQNDDTSITDTLDSIFSLPMAFNIEALNLTEPLISMNGQTYGLTSASGAVRLDQSVLRADSFNVEGDMFTLGGSVALQADAYLLDGSLDWTFMNEATQSVSSEPFSGTLILSGDINSIDINHELLQPVQITSIGNFAAGLLDGTGPNFSFEHRIEDLSIFLPAQDLIDSLGGTLLTHGSPELLFIDADLDLQAQDFAAINLLLSGEYQNQVLSFETISARSPELDLQALAEINLQPFSLTMDWGLNQLELGDYFDSFSLEELRGGGSLAMDDAGNSQLNLSFLTGRLNDYALDAEGLLELSNGTLDSIDLRISTGANRLDLDGSINDTVSLDWIVDAPDLSIWLPALSGTMAGRGMVNGSLDNPFVSGDLQADQLDYRDGDARIQLQSLNANINGALDDYAFSFSLSDLLADIAGRSWQISESRIDLNGAPAAHEGSISLVSDSLNTDFSFAGSYENNTWQGNILSARLDSDYGRWSLEQPLAARLAAGDINIARHCWNYLDTGICMSASLEDRELNLDTTLSNFPLAYLNSAAIVERVNESSLNRLYQDKPGGLSTMQDAYSMYLPGDTYIDGMLDADLQVSGTLDELAGADFSLDLRPENLRLNLFLPQQDPRQSVQPEIRSFSVETQALSLNRSGRAVSGNASLSIYHQENSGLDIQGNVNALVNIDAEQNLQGNVALNFSDLAWLEALLPEIRNTRGELNGSLELLGSIEQPRFISDLRLEQGSFELPEYGIRPEDISIDFISDDAQNLLIDASAISGDGRLSFNGRASSLYTANRTFQLSLLGENFSLINNAGTRMVVSPDLQLNYQNRSLDLQGSVEVPAMDLDIRENDTVLLNNGVDVSRDVVIVNVPPEQAALLSNNRGQDFRDIPLTARLQLILGDSVHFQGLGLDLLLGGDLQLQQDPDRPLLAYGDISITQGSYEIYGQRLDVTNGKLIFFGNPTNPALDIRAYRQNSQIQAGVQINGTLRNMQSQLFSTPTLPDAEILSVLITGKSFADTNDQEQVNLVGAVASLGISRGQGITDSIRSELGLDTLELNSQSNFEQSSLGLGKYLTPDLFMHYEIGLFEKESVLSLDYILNDRVRLEVESGISQSIDMTYTVEK